LDGEGAVRIPIDSSHDGAVESEQLSGFDFDKGVRFNVGELDSSGQSERRSSRHDITSDTKGAKMSRSSWSARNG
jgi:hypothetical protein